MGTKVETAVLVPGSAPLATMANPPSAVLEEAQKAAVALKGVISSKPKPVMMGGEQYLEFEDWQTLGRFYAVTAGEETEPEFVNLDGVKGFKATAVALRNGEVISRATAYCMKDEEKWGARTKHEYHMVLKDGGTAREEDSQKGDWEWEPNPNKPGGKRPKRIKVKAGTEEVPLYQLASMAQTRANAKVLRNVLSWVAVLAGYKPTPAEEMPAPAEAPTPAQPATGKAPPSETLTCIFCGAAEVEVEKDGKSAHCTAPDCGKGWRLGK